MGEAGRGPGPERDTRRLWAAVGAFALGIAAYHRLPFLLPPEIPALALVLALAGFQRRRTLPRGLAVALLAGVFWQGITAVEQMAHPFPAHLERRTVQVAGWVAGPVADEPRRRRFRFRVRRMRLPEGEWRPYRGNLRLSWYRSAPDDLAYGQPWTLAVRVRRPRGFRNPGGFDYARYLHARGLDGTGYVRFEPAPRRGTGLAGSPVRRGVEALRRRVEAAADRAEDGASLLRALTVGKRDRLDPATWETLRATGTAHLVAISGLHVGWVAFLLFAGVRWLWARLPRAPLWLPAPRLAALVAMTGATGYALLAGLSLPTQRALIMVGVGLGAWLLGRPFHFWRALGVAALLVLLWSPGSLLEAGFWLSFTAVAGIGLLLRGPLAGRGWLTRMLVIQVGVAVVLGPWLAFWFGQVSLIAPLANAAAIPFFSLLVVPLALIGAVAALLGWAGAAEPPFALAGRLLDVALSALDRLAGWEGADWAVPPPDLAALACLLGGMGWLIGRSGPGRWAGVAAILLPFAWLGPPGIAPGHARVWILDVGQGSAAVVETARRVAVVDCGPRYGPGFDAGSDLVAPFLLARGWGAVDRLVVSHGDADHSGGCSGLAGRLPVRQWAGAPRALPDGGETLAAGDGWVWDGVRFRILFPPPGSRAEGNPASRVLRVEAGGGSVLLPGDLEAPGEARILASSEDPAADVVVAPHHGSTTSSSPGFVAAADPDWVVYSSGYKNRWGLPAPEVRARWRAAGTRALNTAEVGAVRVELGDGVRISGYRREADRYWHAGADPPPFSPVGALACILWPGLRGSAPLAP